MTDTVSFATPAFAELQADLERTWPDSLARLRASGVPLNEGGGDPADPAAGDPDPGPDPALGDPSAGGDPVPGPAPVQAPAPSIDWNDPEVAAELSRRADAAAAQALEGRLRAAGLSLGTPEPAGLELDPFSDSFGEQLVGLLGQVLDARLGGVDSLMQERTFQTFEDTIGGTIDKLTGGSLEGDAAQAAEFYGVDPEGIRFLGEAFATRVDPSGNDPVGDALKQGATWLKSHDDQVAQNAVNEYRRQLGEIVDTPADPGVTGGGLRIERRDGRSYDDIIAAHAGRFGE